MSKFNLTHASMAQINEVKKDIEDMEKMLQADKIGSQRIQDEAEFRGEIAKKRKFIEQYSPQPLRDVSKNKAYQYAKKLEKEIRDAMPKSNDYFQMYPRSSDAARKEQAFEQAVQWQMKFQSDKRLKKMITEYKHIMRRLEPDNPNASNIERLRRR